MKSIPALASILLIITSGMLFLYSRQKSPTISVPATTRTPSLPITIPNGWQTYTDPTSKYSISYPSEFNRESNGDNSILIVKKVTEPGAVPANFIYISVVPKSERESSGTIYNYYKMHIDSLLKIPVGQSKPLAGEDAGLKEYIIYTRHPDQKIAGKNALSYTNKKPWEFPSGTTEYRYIIQESDLMYLVGGYITEREFHNYSVTKETFDSILRTLTL